MTEGWSWGANRNSLSDGEKECSFHQRSRSQGSGTKFLQDQKCGLRGRQEPGSLPGSRIWILFYGLLGPLKNLNKRSDAISLWKAPLGPQQGGVTQLGNTESWVSVRR